MTQGRKPRPSWVKVVEGNPGRRPVKEPPVKKKSKAADVTPRLRTGARKEVAAVWRKVLKNAPAGVLIGADAEALYRYCIHSVLFDEAEAKLYGPQASRLMKTPNGHIQQSVWVSILNKTSDKLLKYESELGLTPVGRVRLGAETAVLDTEEQSDYFD